MVISVEGSGRKACMDGIAAWRKASRETTESVELRIGEWRALTSCRNGEAAIFRGPCGEVDFGSIDRIFRVATRSLWHATGF